MSSENELYIYLRMEAAQAEATSRAYHSGEQQRIRQTASVEDQAIADSNKAYLRAITLQERAYKELNRTRQQLISQSLQAQKRSWSEEEKQANQSLKAIEKADADAKARRISLAKAAAAAEIKSLQELATASQQTHSRMEASISAATKMSRTEDTKLERASAKERAAILAEAVATFKQKTIEFNEWKKAQSAGLVQADKELSGRLQQISKDTVKEEMGDDRERLRERRRLDNQELAEMRSKGRQERDESRETSKARMAAARELHDSIVKGSAQAAGGVQGIAKAYVALRVASEFGNALNAVMQASAKSTEEARSHMVGLVQQMEQARTAAKEIAQLEGKSPTAMYTAQQARDAANVGADVGDYQQGKLAFQAFAGQYLGKENATDDERAQEAKEGRISFEESQELQRLVATNTGAQGLKQDQSARLAGTIISKRKPGATAQDMALQHRRLTEALKLAPGYTGPLMDQLNEVVQEAVGEGGDFREVEDAAVMMRVVAERGPQEASAYTRGMLRELREIRTSPEKMEELGLTKDMDVFQQVEQVGKRAAENEAETGEKQSDYIGKHFKDARAFGGVRTAIQSGIKGGAINRARADIAKITPETLARENKGYLASQEGQAAKFRSEDKAIELEAASRAVALQPWKHRAHQDLIASRELEESESVGGAFLTREGEQLGFGDRKTQLERSLTAQSLEKRLEDMAASGNEEAANWVKAHPKWGPSKSRLGRTRASEADLIDAANLIDRVQKGNQARRGNVQFDPNKTDAENAQIERAATKPKPVSAQQLVGAANRAQRATGKSASTLLGSEMSARGMRPAQIPSVPFYKAQPTMTQVQAEQIAGNPQMAQEVLKNLNEAAQKLSKAADMTMNASRPQVKAALPAPRVQNR
jgi:hypothetical protein